MTENEWGREEGFRRESSEGRDEVLRAEVVVDDKDEAGLRPRRLEEFVGQVELKEHLGVVLDAEFHWVTGTYSGELASAMLNHQMFREDRSLGIHQPYYATSVLTNTLETAQALAPPAIASK